MTGETVSIGPLTINLGRLTVQELQAFLTSIKAEARRRAELQNASKNTNSD